MNLFCRRFNLRHNGAVELANALSLNETVESLCLWVNHLGDEVTRSSRASLFESILAHSYLSLPQGIEALAPALAQHPSLVKVDLFDNSVGDAGATILAQVLIQSSSIQVLNLRDNMIGDEGSTHAHPDWSHCSERHTPVLTATRVGAFALAGALQSTTCLERLGLVSNPLSFGRSYYLVMFVMQAYCDSSQYRPIFPGNE